MAKKPKKKPKPDMNQLAARIVAEATGSAPKTQSVSRAKKKPKGRKAQ